MIIRGSLAWKRTQRERVIHRWLRWWAFRVEDRLARQRGDGPPAAGYFAKYTTRCNGHHAICAIEQTERKFRTHRQTVHQEMTTRIAAAWGEGEI